MVSYFLVHFVHISLKFICKDAWRPIWKMCSARKTGPVSATGLEFLPNSLCLCACMVCVSARVGHQYSMNFNCYNHIIIGLRLWILIKAIPPPSQAEFPEMQFYLPSFHKDFGLAMHCWLGCVYLCFILH